MPQRRGFALQSPERMAEIAAAGGQAEHETTQGELQDAESERDGMEEVLSLIAGHLEERDKPLGIRYGKALAQTIRGMIETTGRDRFSYAERVRFNEALRHA